MKKIAELWNRMGKKQKIESIIASILTLFLFVGTPIYAWFAYTNTLQTMTKVKEPDSLDIRAGGKPDVIQNFELKDIDLKNISDTGTPKRYVFSVITGDETLHYDIQIAHTTNIPFTYTLYRAEKITSWEGDEPASYDVMYSPTYVQNEDGNIIHVKTSDQKSYYNKTGNALTWQELNLDGSSATSYGRGLAKQSDDYYENTYTPNKDTPQLYAIPRYSVTKNIATLNPNYDYFILELGWDQTNVNNPEGFKTWNEAVNNKETDIIYISARKHTS
ncbi:MAG: hypothetical protein V3G42_08640 [Oscillospiraceae bacterium]